MPELMFRSLTRSLTGSLLTCLSWQESNCLAERAHEKIATGLSVRVCLAVSGGDAKERERERGGRTHRACHYALPVVCLAVDEGWRRGPRRGQATKAGDVSIPQLTQPGTRFIVARDRGSLTEALSYRRQQETYVLEKVGEREMRSATTAS